MCKVVDEYVKEYAEERVVQMAESLMESGVSDEIIERATKLSLEEIAALKEKLVVS